MAVHGALLHRAGERPSIGWLASVRDCVLHCERIDTLSQPLRVFAARVAAGGGALMYGFAIDAGPMRVLVGRATVVLERRAP